MASRLSKRLSSRVLEALASPLRLEILRLLHDEGPLSYSELMDRLKLDPVKHAGRFAYHLKKVQSANLAALSRESRKYQLTDLGWKVYELIQDLEEYSLRSTARLLVRTSRTTIEEFDRSRIVDSLVREAQIPAGIAEEIARKAEERLLDLKVKYLTAPLIREFVNAILIEEGLEEYRHRLTRLGLPVYDVKKTFEEVSSAGGEVEEVKSKAGEAVLREYALLNLIPRSVADSHLSGVLNIRNPGSWILKPDVIIHSITEIIAKSRSLIQASTRRYRDPNLILTSIYNFLRSSTLEVNEEQVIEYFNVFVAPYTLNLEEEELEDYLLAFLANLTGLNRRTSIGLEIEIPAFLADRRSSVRRIRYGDVQDEALRIIRTLTRVYTRMLKSRFAEKPPPLIVKLRRGAKEYDDILSDIHRLIVLGGEIVFSNLSEDQGILFSEGGWIPPPQPLSEENLLRTIWMGGVSINLPRIAYESKGRESLLVRKLEKVCGIAVDAISIRYHTLSSMISANLLPTLFGGEKPYARLENHRCALNLVGLIEAASIFTGSDLGETETLDFAWKMLGYIDEFLEGYESEVSGRIAVASLVDLEASSRLAEMDRMYYGKSIEFQSRNVRSWYTSGTLLPLELNVTLKKRLEAEAEFQRKIRGGALATISLDEAKVRNIEELKDLTLEVAENYGLRWYTYGLRIAYCKLCRRRFIGYLEVCPECGSSRSLIRYHKIGGSYIEERALPDNIRLNVQNMVRYSL